MQVKGLHLPSFTAKPPPFSGQNQLLEMAEGKRLMVVESGREEGAQLVLRVESEAQG